MTVLGEIAAVAAGRALRFAVIGGWAVMHHGFARTTQDLDLVVSREDFESWKESMRTLGYQPWHQAQNFAQFSRSGSVDWPVDLMLVGVETFSGLFDAAESATIQGAAVKVVCLRHLMALKLHVLKQGKLHRFLDDFQDLVRLVQINEVDLHSPEISALFRRYGTSDLYEKLKRVIEH